MPLLDHSWQIALSGRDINSRILGGSSLTYSVDPSLQSSGSTSLTIRATLSGDCTRFLYAVGRGAAAPTKSTIEASGQSFGAVGGVADDAQYTGLAASNDYDIYEFARNAGGQETEVKGPVEGSTNAASDWQLADGHWVSSQWAPIIIAPRPAAELGDGSAYKWAYPSTVYRRRVEVTGGTFPLHFEIVTGPSGATIGEDLEVSGDVLVVGSNYGVVQWTAPSSGTESFTVRVTDQEGRTATVTWSVTVDASRFVFYDSTDSGSANTGTITEPYRTWAACFGTNSTQANNSGKIVYFRSGTHAASGFSDNSGGKAMQLTGDNKPVGWLAYPGESPVIDMSACQVTLASQTDTYIQGLWFDGANDALTDPKTFGILAGTSRTCWFENTFADYVNTDTGEANNNPATLYFSAANRDYIAISANTWTGTCGSGIIAYHCYNSAIRYNKVVSATINQQHSGANVVGFIHLKDGGTKGSLTSAKVSILGNEMWNNVTNTISGDICVGYQDGWLDVEACYNKLGAKGFRECTRLTEYLYGCDFYRNSLSAWTALGAPTNTSEPDITRTKNVVVGSIVTSWGTNFDNVVSATGAFNASMNLQGSFRTSNLGIRGAEIA